MTALPLRVRRRPCTPAEADQAIAALQDKEGCCFGVDAGVPGIHPLQAVVLEQPALRLQVWADGLEVVALTAFGQALLDSDALKAWRACTGRGKGLHALDLARELLGCLPTSEDVVLAGALRFEAHRLASQAVPKPATTRQDDRSLGTLWLAERLLRRDAAGTWTCVTLDLPGADTGPAPPTQPCHAGLDGACPGLDAGASITEGDDHPPGGYADMVRRAVALLREQPLDSLTLSQSYRRKVPVTAAQAFARLRAANPTPASFFLNDGGGAQVFGASPDLQLVVQGRTVSSIPVCGTVGRGNGPAEQAAAIRELLANEVDAAALAVCSRAMQEDLAPLCEPGSLRITHEREVMLLSTVVHALDRIEGRLRPDADAWDAIAATAAPVMLTGTPRALALAAIAQLEASPRGWYGGLLVQVASNGDALVGTLLRAATVRGGIAEVRTGGDLLAGSDPDREEAESRLKTRSLWRAFGIEQAA